MVKSLPRFSTGSNMRRCFLVGCLLACIGNAASADIVVLSDNFSRTGTSPVGTAPVVGSANLPATWTSSWGTNNNYSGGYVSQQYTSYLDSGTPALPYKNTGSGASANYSGNWLNNGASLNVVAPAGTTTEAIGMTGFAWTQLNHNFANDTNVQSASSLRISFDIYRGAGGNVSWFFGQSDTTGVANGSNGTPTLTANNDIGLFFRGTQAAGNNFGLADSGVIPGAVAGITDYNNLTYASGTGVVATDSTDSVRIEIFGTNFSNGQQSLLALWVNDVQQDLNGSAAGSSYSFTWDNGGGGATPLAYMGFASNTQNVTAAGLPVAVGFDNLVITAVPEPTSIALICTAGLGGAVQFLRRRKKQANA
jgi:hypothetical protein